jgi:hypothetical protein
MVLSRDIQEVSVLECILGGLQIGVEIETEPTQALSRLSRSKIDALIVDCDLQGSRGLLRDLQNANFKNSVPLVIVSGSRQTLRPRDLGTQFVFQKPISVEQAVQTLSAARNVILDGRLRYHRQELDIKVFISQGKRSHCEAFLLNLSQGGIGIRLNQGLPLSRSLSVCFALPGKKRAFKAHGEVAWIKPGHSAGIRFTELSSRTRRELQLWLEQQYFLH